MSAVNTEILLDSAYRLEQFKVKLNTYFEQLSALKSQMQIQSYMEEECRLIKVQMESLEETLLILSQMIRALKQAGETYMECEMSIADAYESDIRVYPAPEIGSNPVMVNENLNNIISILLKDKGV